MSATLVFENYPAINSKENTLVATSAIVGAGDVVVENAQNIVANDFIYLGSAGTEQVEKQKISSVTAQTLDLVGTLAFAHKRFSLVRAVYGDQIQIYRAANVDGSVPLDASFATLDSPIDLDPDQLSTTYIDATGSTEFWYKHVYFNSGTAAEVTSLNAVKAVRGGNYGEYASTEQIRKQAGISKNPYITDGEVALKRLSTQAEIDAALNTLYTVPFGDDVPDLVRQVCILIAAGYILINEYGATASGTSKDGKEMLEEGRELLRNIASGTADLVDISGASLVTTRRVRGWPNNTTKDAKKSEGGGERIHRMSDVF